ncbi:MAG: dihydrofolate reductase family protein [Ginsengibacter sp.]
MHASLDGFVAGPNGEMDWINVGDDMFEFAGKQTDRSDTALYGRVTYGMMQSYWPTAGDQPNASKHDKQHSGWYNKVHKVVLSTTMQESNMSNVQIINKNLYNSIIGLKESGGQDIVIFGSPTAVHSLMAENLIDEYWLFVNPVLLAKGIPLFKNFNDQVKLKLLSTDTFGSGVVCLHYEKI